MDHNPTRIRPTAGTANEADATSAVGAGLRIAGVELVRELGRGGMAAVYEGLDSGFSPPSTVAVKLMDPALGGDPEFRERFKREASLMREFRNNNIIRVYSSGETADGVIYIVMEYLAGGTLAQRLESGPLAVEEALGVATAMADALAYSHSQNVVHRDFKPGNILFTIEGTPVLSDFGVAKRTTAGDAGLTRHAMSIGAPRYMAPEQDRAEEVTDRADVYALALTIFEMLAGRSPPARLRTLRGSAAIAELQQVLPPGVSGRLVQLLCRCLQFNPEDRPSASEAAQLLRAQSGVDTQSRGTTRTGERRRTFLSGGVLWVGGSALLVLLTVAGYVLWSERAVTPDQTGSAVARVVPAAAAPAPLPRLPSRAEFDRFLDFSEDDYPLTEADVASMQDSTLQDALRYKWLLKSGAVAEAGVLKQRTEQLANDGNARAAVASLLLNSLARGGRLGRPLITPQLQAASGRGDAMASFYWAGALRSELAPAFAQDDPTYLQMCRLLRLTQQQGWADVAVEAGANECPAP